MEKQNMFPKCEYINRKIKTRKKNQIKILALTTYNIQNKKFNGWTYSQMNMKEKKMNLNMESLQIFEGG